MNLQEKRPSAVHLVNTFFSVVTAALLVFFWAGTVLGASWYVKPSAEVPVRSGQGTEYKILAVVPDGMQVELIEENDPWAMVRTPGGTEGWMLKRYLSSDKPLTDVITDLQEQKARLAVQEEQTGQKYDELLTAYSQNEQELNTCIADRDETGRRYQELQKDTADVISIKKNLENTTLELQAVRQKLATVLRENEDLKQNSSIKWFMAGGSVLIIGIVLGVLGSRSRKRKSSLY